jgi:putative acetyltransferase
MIHQDCFIRRATTNDADLLAALYRNTITTINRHDYNEEQVAAWAGRSSRTESLLQRIRDQYFLVAETNSVISGFASITQTGYLDMLFVHKDYQRQGIASLLYDALEIFAASSHAREITAEVSITARPFFEKKGLVVYEGQQVDIDGVLLTNFKMRKKM